MACNDLPGRVKLIVNKNKLRDNFRKIAEKVAPCNILTVLKANAYGTGADVMGQLAAECGTNRIGVADLNEALAMQKATAAVPVQILGVVTPDELPVAVANDLILPVDGLAMAKAISNEAVKQNKTVRVNLILDTGMGRFGWLSGFCLEEIKAAVALPNLIAEGIYSHFPCAGTPGEAGTTAQIREFIRQCDELAANNVNFACRHIAASDGILCQQASTSTPFNLVRLGLCWYGVCQTAAEKAFALEPTLELTTCVGAVRKMPAGSTIGYNRTVKLSRETMVATICAGYADGLPLALSNNGRVLINGTSCPIIGRVSMDYTMIDVSNVPGEITWGTPVTVFGSNGKENIPAGEVAKAKNTHIHDILCAISNRVQRVYIG